MSAANGAPASSGPTTHARQELRTTRLGPADAPEPIADVLARLTGKPADATLPAGTAPIVGATTADVENDGDRGRAFCGEDPAITRGRAELADACRALPAEWISVATWIVRALPTLRAEVRARTVALSEVVRRDVDRHDDSDKRPSWTSREDTALASLWRAVLDVSRLIDPRRDIGCETLDAGPAVPHGAAVWQRRRSG